MTIAELLSKHATVALDSNILIYVLEASPLGARAHALFTALEEGRLRATLSSVALAEILAGPAQLRDLALFETYAAELRAIPNLRIVPVDAEVATDAAWVRGTGSVALADALHLACARRSGATAFITNDRRIRPLAQLDVIYLEDLEAA